MIYILWKRKKIGGYSSNAINGDSFWPTASDIRLNALIDEFCLVYSTEKRPDMFRKKVRSLTITSLGVGSVRRSRFLNSVEIMTVLYFSCELSLKEHCLWNARIPLYNCDSFFTTVWSQLTRAKCKDWFSKLRVQFICTYLSNDCWCTFRLNMCTNVNQFITVL